MQKKNVSSHSELNLLFDFSYGTVVNCLRCPGLYAFNVTSKSMMMMTTNDAPNGKTSKTIFFFALPFSFSVIPFKIKFQITFHQCSVNAKRSHKTFKRALKLFLANVTLDSL